MPAASRAPGARKALSHPICLCNEQARQTLAFAMPDVYTEVVHLGGKLTSGTRRQERALC